MPSPSPPPPTGDPQVDAIQTYFWTLDRKREVRTRKAHAQYYTTHVASVLLASLAMPDQLTQPQPDGRPPPLPRVMDFCCGAGMLLLSTIREAARVTGHPVADIVRSAIACDIDLGAIATCRRVLSSLSPPAEPSCYWADMLFNFTWRLGRVDLDPLDIDLADKAGAEFVQEMVPWLPQSPDIASRPRDIVPLGTVDVRADGRVVFRYDPDPRPLVLASELAPT